MMKLTLNGILKEMEQRLQSADQANRICGIPLVEYELYTPFFRETIAAAFAVAERKDPRRFRRICRYLKGIVSLPVNSEAGYIPQIQACAIRFQPPPSKEKLPKWAAWYAAILLHEATHGLVHARGIPYEEHKERIERLCFKEQNRFLRRLGLTPESLTKLQQMLSFKPTAYQPKSFWQNWREIRQRAKAEKARQGAASGGGDR